MSMPRRTLVLTLAISCALAGLVTWTLRASQSGIHYRTSDETGARVGRQVARFVLTHALK